MDFLSASVMGVLMVGATHYVDIGAPREAVIFYQDEQLAHMVLPDGAAWSGVWRLTDTGYHVAWQDGPSGDWRLNYAPGRIGYVNGDGEELGTISRIVFGNAESLPSM
ncbi:MAG: hypothetical protein ACFB01_06205 [Cohaesibacteraceae bacterium]